MAAKYYCDGCGEEIASAEQDGHRATFKLGNIWIQTLPAVNGTWNAGHVCVSCVQKTVLEGIAQREDPSFVASLCRT